MFDYMKTTTNLVGSGSANEIGKHLKKFGSKKALIVTDKDEISSGNIVKLLKYLENHHIMVVIFENKSSIPLVESVHRAASLYKEKNCDSIIALGGGSTIDTAKAIGILVNNGGTIYDYEGTEMATHMPPPTFAINTFTNISNLSTLFKVFDDEFNGNHILINDWRTIPNVCISDTELEENNPIHKQFY